ncbi:MAG: EamA family transporter [Candidatus Micrarchaeota archaeon]|nr:EamA family transporter [Candidatus Micrarchaeota archaeon]
MVPYAYGIFAKTSSLPIIAAVAAFAGGVTVICALAILKERPEKNQLIGIVLAIAGIVVLSYLS